MVLGSRIAGMLRQYGRCNCSPVSGLTGSPVHWAVSRSSPPVMGGISESEASRAADAHVLTLAVLTLALVTWGVRVCLLMLMLMPAELNCNVQRV
eukprot:CAMPEP_0170594918 /NCGR_PEP_ID=MMETSP0224-20130122/14264_1 /TAXON_ID=285029 /ORGANISM="Togula jolla, Strain CCCM 725" /LENGTH=94 /DNA_ID=CAMNT_0010919023 /DNA_START=291 /DNA_END=573 /DNA_ORIENTATION=-